MLDSPKFGEKAYKVTRNCCDCGNCVTCIHLPYGSKVRVSQMGDKRLTKKDADMIASNWSRLGSKVEEWEERNGNRE